MTQTDAHAVLQHEHVARECFHLIRDVVIGDARGPCFKKQMMSADLSEVLSDAKKTTGAARTFHFSSLVLVPFNVYEC